MKPKKQCNHSRCRTLIDYDKKYCKEHKGSSHKKYDATRDEATKDFYSGSEWRKVRKQALIRDGWICQECLKHGLITNADTVHHIIEVKDDFSKRYDIDNTLSICRGCHNRIHSS